MGSMTAMRSREFGAEGTQLLAKFDLQLETLMAKADRMMV
jgi:hypothetical protein